MKEASNLCAAALNLIRRCPLMLNYISAALFHLAIALRVLLWEDKQVVSVAANPLSPRGLMSRNFDEAIELRRSSAAENIRRREPTWKGLWLDHKRWWISVDLHSINFKREVLSRCQLWRVWVSWYESILIKNTAFIKTMCLKTPRTVLTRDYLFKTAILKYFR